MSVLERSGDLLAFADDRFDDAVVDAVVAHLAAEQRPVPLPVLCNALWFDALGGMYDGPAFSAVLDRAVPVEHGFPTGRDPRPRPEAVPLGAIVRFTFGQDERWGEVAWKEGAHPELDAGWVPRWLAGAPALPEDGSAPATDWDPPPGPAVVRERVVVNFAFLGPDLDLPANRFVPLRRAGSRLDRYGHLVMDARYDDAQDATDHIGFWATWVADRHADALELAGVPADPAVLAAAAAHLADALDSRADVRRHDVYYLHRDVFDRAVADVDDTADVAGRLRRVVRSLTHLPAHRRSGWASMSQRVADEFGDDAVAGLAWPSQVLTATLLAFDTLAEEAPDGDWDGVHVRLDDLWQGGGLWRTERVDDTAPIAADPSVVLGLGWMEHTGALTADAPSAAAATTAAPSGPGDVDAPADGAPEGSSAAAGADAGAIGEEIEQLLGEYRDTLIAALEQLEAGTPTADATDDLSADVPVDCDADAGGSSLTEDSAVGAPDWFAEADSGPAEWDMSGSEGTWLTHVTGADIDTDRLRVPTRIGEFIARTLESLGQDRLVVVFRHDGQPEERQFVRVGDDGHLNFEWPFGVLPGTSIRAAWTVGGTVVTAASTLLAVEEELLQGLLYRHEFNRHVALAAAGVRTDEQRTITLRDLVTAAVRRRGTVTDDGRRALSLDELVSFCFGPDGQVAPQFPPAVRAEAVRRAARAVASAPGNDLLGELLVVAEPVSARRRAADRALLERYFANMRERARSQIRRYWVAPTIVNLPPDWRRSEEKDQQWPSVAGTDGLPTGPLRPNQTWRKGFVKGTALPPRVLQELERIKAAIVHLPGGDAAVAEITADTYDPYRDHPAHRRPPTQR